MSGSSVSHHKRQMLSRHDVTRTLATAPLQEIDSYKTKLYVTGWGGEGGGGGSEAIPQIKFIMLSARPFPEFCINFLSYKPSLPICLHET